MHAEDMLRERDIERDWVLQALVEPEHVDTDERHAGRMRAFRRIAAHGDRWLRVVYEATDAETVVITVMFDRGAGRW